MAIFNPYDTNQTDSGGAANLFTSTTPQVPQWTPAASPPPSGFSWQGANDPLGWTLAQDGGTTTAGPAAPSTSTSTGSNASGFQFPTFTPPAWNAPSPLTAPTPFSYANFVAPTLQDAQNAPGYQFGLQQGEQALQNSAAAKGVLRTGGTLKDILGWGNQFATQNYGNVFNQQAQVYGTNRSNAADAYNTNYNVARDVWNLNTQEGLNAYDRQFNASAAAFNPQFQAAQLKFADLFNRQQLQQQTLASIANAGAS